jgi:hypothetical protein
VRKEARMDFRIEGAESSGGSIVTLMKEELRSSESSVLTTAIGLSS